MQPLSNNALECGGSTPLWIVSEANMSRPKAVSSHRTPKLAWLIPFFLNIAASAQDKPRSQPPSVPPFEFTRMVAHWTDYGRPDYLDFIHDAEPEVVQVGFYGAHFWSLVHTPQFGGYLIKFRSRSATRGLTSGRAGKPIRCVSNS